MTELERLRAALALLEQLDVVLDDCMSLTDYTHHYRLRNTTHAIATLRYAIENAMRKEERGALQTLTGGDAI